ncbi:hypothetical protein BJY00DRAFT_306665 [Aspergillus carlsbadensis]|nr:hypothetical protein BJY00DRAFT_306665 [Aspergillus carlsbadensis]
MRFTQILACAASAALVAAAPSPSPINPEALEAFKQLDDPEAFKVFNEILNGTFPSLTRRGAEPEKRCCSGVCCNFSTCETDVTFCIEYCAGIPNAGGAAGCIAGCYVACD